MFSMSVVRDFGGGVEEAEQPVGRAITLPDSDLVDHRRDERLLALDPAEVAAVGALDVPDPDVAERLLAADLPGAGLDDDAVLLVVDVLGDADLDAVDRVDHVLEALEVDDHVVVDPDVGELLELADRAGGAADGEGLVPHRRRRARDGVARLVDAVGPVDQRVARDRDAVGALPVRREVDHDRGVRPLAAAGQAVDVVAGAVAAVGAHHQDVDRVLRALDLDLLGPVLAQLGAEVLDVEVAVEVAVEERDAETGDHAEDHDRREQHLGDGVRPAAPAAALALPVAVAVAVVGGRRQLSSSLLRVAHRHLHRESWGRRVHARPRQITGGGQIMRPTGR